MFAYCNNNPIFLVDSTGTITCRFSFACYDGAGGAAEREEDQEEIRDVTDEVMAALTNACNRGKTLRIVADLLRSVPTEAIIYYEFYNLVNHSASWDIKREKPWQETIGTPYPGYNEEVLFNGMIMTPEMLGNYTYGYLGHAYGIPLIVLLVGSYYAAGFPTEGDALKNEVWDWGFVAMGYNDAT